MGEKESEKMAVKIPEQTTIRLCQTDRTVRWRQSCPSSKNMWLPSLSAAGMPVRGGLG